MKERQPYDISPYDTAEFLRTPEEISDYLEAVFTEYGNDYRTVVKALGNVARAQGMQKIADATGLQRQGLYKSLSESGNPSFETVLKVMAAIGVELRPKAVPRKTRGGSVRSPNAAVGKVKVKKRLETDSATGKWPSIRKKRAMR